MRNISWAVFLLIAYCVIMFTESDEQLFTFAQESTQALVDFLQEFFKDVKVREK